MRKPNQIDVALAIETFAYRPDLGASCLAWKTSGSGRRGILAGSKYRDGRWMVILNGKRYPAHRIVWAIVKGEDPVGDIDHILGYEVGNHIENLRVVEVTGQNQQNRKLQVNNALGYAGVRMISNGRYRAVVYNRGKQKHIGYFDTPEEAHKAYLVVKAQLHDFFVPERLSGI